MKRTFILGLVSLNVIFALACGGSSDTGAANSNQVSASNAVNQPLPANGAPAAGIPDPGQAQSNLDVNAPSAGNVNMPGRRPIIDVPSNGPVPTPTPANGPEDSQIYVSSSKDGSFTQRRVFKSDNVISRVETVIRGSDRSAKIYLKNGRVVSVDPNKISSINTITIAQLMDLAGVKPKPAPQPRPNTDQVKKPQ